MRNIFNQIKKVRVCSGVSCRAWDSEEVARELYSGRQIRGKRKKIQVGRVACMNRCGGGVSVQIPSSGMVIKIRKPEEAMRIVA